jgi:YebC/PmpR family DNA-binding regulatory protein
MSGHSKLQKINHNNGASHPKLGKAITRKINEHTKAARHGGGDPHTNPPHRTQVADAKANNMPRDNIERAIRRGTGEEPGVSYEEILYEAYGPGGVALLIQTVTDNRNRTVGEMRYLLSKHNGNLASENSVAWMFTKKGQVFVERAGVDEEALLAAMVDAGADDVSDDDNGWEIVCPPEQFETVRDAVKALGIDPASAEVAQVPQNYVKLEGKEAQQMLKLLDAIDDHDDVQHVWANHDIEEKEIEASLA